MFGKSNLHSRCCWRCLRRRSRQMRPALLRPKSRSAAFSRSAVRRHRSASSAGEFLPTFNPSMTAAASMAARSTTSRWTTPTARRKRWSTSASLWRATRCPSFSASSARREIPRSAKYLAAKRRSSDRDRQRLEQVHQRQDLPADDDGAGQLRYRRKDLRQVSEQERCRTRKYAILYQNDDLGKDYVNAFKALSEERFRQEGRHRSLRNHRPDCRFAGGQSEEFGRGSASRGRHAEICGAGDTQGRGDRLEADADRRIFRRVRSRRP